MTIRKVTAGDLVPIGYRFPLARPVFDIPLADDEPGTAAAPFGLRFFRPTGSVADMRAAACRYDPTRQVAVTDDGTDTPLIALPVSQEKTMTGYTDGGKPRGEEFRIDYAGDCGS